MPLYRRRDGRTRKKKEATPLSPAKKLSQVGEEGLIKKLRGQFPALDDSIIIGIGDDTAALRPDPDKTLLVTTDLLVEQIDFDLSYTSFYQIGYKAVSVNFSDIAAVGGKPRYLLVSLALPSHLHMSDVNELYRGIKKMADRYRVSLIGGDTSASPDGIFLTLMVIGEAKKGCIISRKGATPGEGIFVTGTLGDSASGLEVLRSRGAQEPGIKRLIRRHLCPTPRLAEGGLLADREIASSMIDLSDGLASDLRHLCTESGVGAEIDLTRIPLSPALVRFSTLRGKDPLHYALTGGEDFELLFTVKKDKLAEVEECILRKEIRATRVGETLPRRAGIRIRDRHGKVRPLTVRGYEHFKSPS